MANFADIVKAQRSKGSSVIGSIGTALGRTTLEKVDPRNYLFNRSGVLTALFPSLKGYQAKATTEKISSTTTSGGGLSSGQTEMITEKLDQVITQNQIVAKNSMVLPMMHRDINVMRQSMVKMVRIMGGTQRDKADRFFMNSKARESAYEAQFGKAPTPINKEGKEPEKEGFFSKLLGSGLMPMLVKGGLALLVAGSIKTYFSDPEFKKTVNDAVKTVFNTILDLMKEHWGITLGALALLFPSSTLSLIGSGLSTLATVLTGGAAGGGLIGALGTLTKAIMSPAGGVVAALAYLAYKITSWADTADINNPGSNPIANIGAMGKKFADWVNETSGYNSEIDQRRENIAKGLHADGTPYKPSESVGKGPTLQQSIDHYEKLLANAKNDAEKNAIQQALDSLYKMPGAPKRGESKTTAPTQTRTTSTAPTPAPAPAAAPAKTSSTSPTTYDTSNEMANLIRKKFKEAGFSDAQAEAAVSNAIAESSLNPKARNTRGGEDSVGLFQMNRNGGLGSGYTVEQLSDPNFNIDLAIAAAKKSPKFMSATNVNDAIAAFVQDVEKPRDTYAAINKRINIASAGNQVGKELNMGSSALAYAQRTGGNVRMENVGNVYNTNNGGNQQPAAQLASAEVGDRDLMQELFRKRGISYT